MNSRLLRWQFNCVVVLCALQAVASAEEFCLDISRPACGKVCKLVCETKKLTSICYGCECKDICLPERSREGCKHCAVCYGKCASDACGNCQSCPPKCEFCWRDWFACGCAEPRTVRVLTKYQAEKKICWYHWEVVDAACCDGVSPSGPAGAEEKNAKKQAKRTIYKSAPENAQLGAVLPVSEEEWVKLAAVLSPDPTEVAADDPETADGNPKAPSVSERLQKILKR
jgi:hypothetical protein